MLYQDFSEGSILPLNHEASQEREIVRKNVPLNIVLLGMIREEEFLKAGVNLVVGQAPVVV